MKHPFSSPSDRQLFSARSALAIVVLVQTLGLVLSVAREGSAIGSWLFLDLRWSEPSSIAFERAGTLAALIASLALVRLREGAWRNLAAVLVSGWFLAIAVAERHFGGAPFTDLSILAHMTRIAAPLVYVLWDRGMTGTWLARVAVAVTFAIHGFEALALHPGFVDYLLIADRRLVGAGINQAQAELLLRFIGTQDLLVAAVILTGRAPRWVLAWAAFWGVTTALSRVVQGDLGAAHLAVIRAANGGLPLVLWLSARAAAGSTPSDTVRWPSVGRRASSVSAGLVTLLLAFAATAQAQTLTAGKPGHLRLIWTEDPAHRATMSWSTTTAGSKHTVYLDTQPRGGNVSAYAMKVDAAVNGTYQSGGPYYHHADVMGLTPDTTYYFVVESDGNVSPERHFITAHTDDREFRLLYGGDSRSGVTDRRTMNKLMASFVEKDPGIIALSHGGDYIATASSWSEWNSWLEDHALTFTAAGRVLPIIPARGNHEGDGVMYNRVFGFPGGTSVDYFTTKIGAHVSLITLDSNVSLGGDQQKWLEQELQKAQSGRWIIPSYHRPAYPAVKTPGGALQFWVPLFEKYNVDVVCEADGHVLKRTVPIRNGKQDPTGIVYVGEGGLGVPQRTPISAWYLKAPGMAKGAHHVQVFSFSPQELRYEARLMNGTVDDSYVFTPRRNPVTPEPEPEPAQPTISTVVAKSATQVEVVYSVDMDPSTAAVPTAYQVSSGVTVMDTVVQSARTILLTTSALTPDTEYVLNVTGPTSVEGGVLQAGTQLAFRSLPAEGTEEEPSPVVPETPVDEETPTTPPEQRPVDEAPIDEEFPPVRGGCATAPGLVGILALVSLGWLGRRRKR